MNNVTLLTETNIKSHVADTDKPMLVDFYAEWCFPCKMLSPVLEEVAQHYDGRIVVAKLDIDKSRKIARQFNVKSVPTLILFKNGEPVDHRVGNPGPQGLVSMIETHI